MRYKNSPLPFNFSGIADAESVLYNDDRNMGDVSSNRGAMIAANKTKNKYKKMRAKNSSLLFDFDLDETEQAETANYVDDIDIANVNLNRNAAITPKKISDKYKKIRRKRKRARSVEPVEEAPKRPKTNNNSKKLVMMGAKKIRDKYKNLRYR